MWHLTIDDADYDGILRVFHFSNTEFLNFKLNVLMWNHRLHNEYRNTADGSRNKSLA